MTNATLEMPAAASEVDPLLAKPDVMRLLQVKSNVFNNLIQSGRLKSVKIGRLRRVRRSDLAAYIAGLTGEAE